MVSGEDEVRTLLMAALDGDATQEQRTRLNELLESSDQLRRTAARFLHDDSTLREELGALDEAANFLMQANDGRAEPIAATLGMEQVGQRAAPAERGQTQREPRTAGSSSGRRLRSMAEYVNGHGLVVAAAAALLVMAFGWHYATMMAKFDRLYSLAAATDPEELKELRQRAQRNGRPGVDYSVARITGLSDCRWPAGAAGHKFGDRLSAGQRLQLTSGVLQLTYSTGARVTVEGPVDMIMTNAGEAKLSAGKIAAVIPRFARGYTVLTPTAEVVDLGTEFGVSVDDSGASEVHVFDGDVVTRSLTAGVPGGEVIHAREQQAVQFGGSSAEPRWISFDGQKFKRRLIPDIPADELPPLPVTSNLALWLAADVMPGIKEGDPVAAWPDLLVGDNKFPDDAWQFDQRLCPAWGRDGDGRPCVRFDGWSTYLATSPMATGNRQTAFVVFASSPASFASVSHGGMLLKYGADAPTLELSLLTDQVPRGLVWANDEVGSPSNVGMLTGRAVEPLAPCAVAYAYDAVGNKAELLIDGKSQGRETAPRPIEQHAKKYIGSHAEARFEAYFLGNIYEVIVYDGILEVVDRDRVFQYLSKRYGIASAQ